MFKSALVTFFLILIIVLPLALIPEAPAPPEIGSPGNPAVCRVVP